MGNGHGGIRLLKHGECSHHFKLGQSASMSVKEGEKKREDDGKESQTWEVSYNTEESTCTVSMTKTTGRDSKDELLEIIIKDFNQEKINDNVSWKEYTECFKHKIGKFKGHESRLVTREVGFTKESIEYSRPRGRVTFSWKTKTPYVVPTEYCWDSSSRTLVEIRTLQHLGSGTRKGLYYSEWNEEKKGKPRTVTLVHYYAHSNSGEKLPKSKIDIGFSIVMKIRVLDNGNLDFKIDGPIEHPCSDLFYMFEKVRRTGSWTPTSCPHCADIQIQRQRGWLTSWQSDSEDGDSHGSQQITRNNGRFAGDGNGSIYEKNIMVNLKKFKFLT